MGGGASCRGRPSASDEHDGWSNKSTADRTLADRRYVVVGAALRDIAGEFGHSPMECADPSALSMSHPVAPSAEERVRPSGAADAGSEEPGWRGRPGPKSKAPTGVARCKVMSPAPLPSFAVPQPWAGLAAGPMARARRDFMAHGVVPHYTSGPPARHGRHNHSAPSADITLQRMTKPPHSKFGSLHARIDCHSPI